MRPYNEMHFERRRSDLLPTLCACLFLACVIFGLTFLWVDKWSKQEPQLGELTPSQREAVYHQGPRTLADIE